MKTTSLLDLAVENKIVSKSGAWYSFQGERVGQGRENAKLFLAEHESMSQQIETLLLEHFGLKRAAFASDKALEKEPEKQAENQAENQPES